MGEFSYISINKPTESLIKIKGSKFYGALIPMEDEADLKRLIAEKRKAHPQANHHCYAYRINPSEIYERANDDGEPSGTAGKPILGQLHANDLVNCGLVVTRLFGGTKLGTGGLISAYRESAAETIYQAKLVEKNIYREITVQNPVSESYKLHEFVGRTESNILESTFEGEDNILKVQVALKSWQMFDEWINSFDNRSFKIITPK